MGLGQKKKLSLDLLEEETDYLITAHVKYKDMLMYNSALQQFQELIKYGQLESMTYSERFGFLIGFKECLKTMREMRLQEQLKLKSEVAQNELKNKLESISIVCQSVSRENKRWESIKKKTHITIISYSI